MAQELDLENGPTIDWVLAQGVSHLLAAKYFMLASFVMLVYDHALTFSDEVDRIWQREWTGATWLFALNRYLTELQFIVNLVSFHDPSWSAKVCDRFIPFPGVSTLLSVGIAEIVLILRTYALYQRSNYILTLLTAVWCGQMIAMAATMHDPVRVVLPEGLVGCILGGHGDYAAAFWLAPLAMDTLITGLTVFKTLQYLRRDRNYTRLVQVILRDGLLYFAVIVAANLSNCLVYYLAPADLKVVGASFAQIITIMMISRLQLNLRSESITSPKSSITGHSSLPSLPISSNREKRLDSKGTSGTISTLSHFFDSTVTELGKDIASLNPEVGEGQVEAVVETQVVDEEMEIEMGPIRPVSGGVQDDNVFSEEEREWLETMIQVSPAIVEERRDDG